MTPQGWLKKYDDKNTHPFNAYRAEISITEASVIISSLLAETDALKESLQDKVRLVRELDVIWNGENAAKQASLCDMVAQIGKELPAIRAEVERWKDAYENMRDFAISRGLDVTCYGREETK